MLLIKIITKLTYRGCYTFLGLLIEDLIVTNVQVKMELLVKKYMITRVIKPIVIGRLMTIDKQVLHRNVRECKMRTRKLLLLIEQHILAKEIPEGVCLEGSIVTVYLSVYLGPLILIGSHKILNYDWLVD